MTKCVQSRFKLDDRGGRGECYLKRPNDFLTCGSVSNSREKPDLLPPGAEMNRAEPDDIQNAAAMLSNLLPRQTPPKQHTFAPLPVARAPQLTLTSQDHNEFLPSCQSLEPEAILTNQPYRTLPLVLPHAKTIHDQVPQSMAANREIPTEKPYRNSSLAMPGPKTIHEAGVGAGPYQPYRGPQFYMDRKPVEKTQPVYNSAIHLYSKSALESEAASRQSEAKEEPPAVSKESATHQLVLETQSNRPDSQLSNSSDKRHSAVDPVMKDSTINQSASFKKVMYSVMGDSEF